MEEGIINKVAQSSLVVFDLEDYYPDEHVVNLDVSQWLAEGFILRETDFRAQLKELCIVQLMQSYRLGRLL
jgi:hypothetical protein